jgi:hypothetical protein
MTNKSALLYICQFHFVMGANFIKRLIEIGILPTHMITLNKYKKTGGLVSSAILRLEKPNSPGISNPIISTVY